MNFIDKFIAKKIIGRVLTMSALAGYRTYIIAACAAVLTGLQYAGVIDQHLYETLMGFLGAGGLATLRAAGPK